MSLKEGDLAPDFNVLSSNGKKVSLRDFNGKKKIVLYFYPKDDTPGCTVEACNFRDKIQDIENKDTVILGVSLDGIDSHNKFIQKFNLPFILLSDEDKKICQIYEVWVKKSMYGKKYMGVERSTFIIDKDGKIKKIFRKVKPETHVEEVLASL